MITPNILLTNFCNQNCGFCFARQEMSSTNKPKEMSLKDYRFIIKRLSCGKKLKTVKLLGGEPLLHSNIEQIVRYTFSHSETLQLFTNGIFGKEKLTFLQPYARRLALIVNVSTPGFIKNPLLRKLVLHNIEIIGKKGHIVLSLTVGKNANGLKNIAFIPKRLAPYIQSVRIGVINPLTNNYPIEELPILGRQVFELVKKTVSFFPSVKIFFNCGFTPCMFSSPQLNFFQKKGVSISGWGCFGKDGQLDITVDSKIIGCYVSSEKGLYSRGKNMALIGKKITQSKYREWFKKRSTKCSYCQDNIFNGGSCPGPCLG